MLTQGFALLAAAISPLRGVFQPLRALVLLLRSFGFALVAYSYWASFLAPGLYGWHVREPLLMAAFPLVFGFVHFPILDYLVGRDRANHTAREERWFAKLKLLQLVPLLVVPLQATALVLGARMFAEHTQFDWRCRILWTLAFGLCMGMHGIVAAHELIHRLSRIQRVLGGLLLSMSCYGTFKVEHIRGHHVDVATDEDASSARRNQSLYHFIPRAIFRNVAKAWRLEARRLRSYGYRPFNVRNELIWWTASSVAIAAALGLAFGPSAILFFLGQAVVAIAFLEAVNYVEHYGIRRRRLADGTYEHIRAEHSWETSYLLSNWFLFNLQRHADHHLVASRPYYMLRYRHESPQLPGPYAAMILFALVPWLWRRTMNRRLPPDSGGLEERRWDPGMPLAEPVAYRTRSQNT